MHQAWPQEGVLLGLLPTADLAAVIGLLQALGFDLYAPEMVAHLTHPDSLLHGLQEFREHLGGQLTIMLLTGIGQGLEVHTIDEALMAEAVRRLQQYNLVPAG